MVVGLEVGVKGGAVVEMEVEVRGEVGLALGGGIFVWVHPA